MQSAPVAPVRALRPDPIVTARADALQRRPVLIYDQHGGTGPAYMLAVGVPTLGVLLGIAAIVTPAALAAFLDADRLASLAPMIRFATIGLALLLVALPWLLVARDRAQLRERGFLPQSWAWLFLGPFWYFVVRWAVLARQSGERAGGPLWAHVIAQALLAAGVGAAIWFLLSGDATLLPGSVQDAVRAYLPA